MGPTTKDIGAIIRDGKALDRAIERTHQRVLRRHRQTGIPVVIWRDGKVVEVPADAFDSAKDAR